MAIQFTVYCECGCGEATTIPTGPKVSRAERDVPRRFIAGHSSRGKNNPSWKGGRFVSDAGYVFVRMPGHHRADSSGYVREHILIAEGVLGKPLSRKVHVHHMNEDGTDNRNCNLVICEDAGYHRLLHQRTRALRASGHADWRRCVFCKEYDAPNRLSFPANSQPYHRNCASAYRRIRRAA